MPGARHLKAAMRGESCLQRISIPCPSMPVCGLGKAMPRKLRACRPLFKGGV